MVMITEGMQLRIPVGALTLSLDGPTVVRVERVEVRLDTWQHWLRIAIMNVYAAHRAHDRLLTPRDERAKARALESEFRASMIASAAGAFAVDAFYASVKDRLPPDPEKEAAWAKNRTPRPRRIAETLRTGFRLTSTGFSKVLRPNLKKLFELRDWAVHPPARFGEPLVHPDLGIGADWRFATYTASTCTEATRVALSLVSQCCKVPRPNHAELSEWSKFVVTVITPIVTRWERRFGSVILAEG